MENTAARWDAEAKDYQSVFKLGQNEYNNALFEFWKERGMLRPGYRVLDIGCGVGKYGAIFARYGCDVTLTDISPEMIAHAERNMSVYSVPWKAFVCDFTKADSGVPEFKDGFDFSISTMSPAVCDAASVGLMSSITHGWCFITRFYSWEQPSRDAVFTQLGLKAVPIMTDTKGDCANIIEAVQAVGYEPEVLFADYCWSDSRTSDEQADLLKRRYDSLKDIPADEVKQAVAELSDINGRFTDSVNTKVAWIFWKTT